MRIQTIVSQHRRDFFAIFECEHCNHSEQLNGYDDANFHNNVIPDMVCKKCECVGPASYRPLTPKYPEGAIV